MPERPQLLENLGPGTTHAAALAYLVDDLDPRFALDVATGYVNLGGLHHLALTVDDGRQVRLLLGAVPGPGLGAELPLTRFEMALQMLMVERDLARFPPSRAAARLGEVDAWLDRPELKVRRYVSRFLHGKAYLFGDIADGRAALVTSANLTTAGLLAPSCSGRWPRGRRLGCGPCPGASAPPSARGRVCRRPAGPGCSSPAARPMAPGTGAT